MRTRSMAWLAMTRLSTACAMIASTGCVAHLTVRPPQIAIKVHAEVRAGAQLRVPVPIHGSEVVEFFGVPLDGAQDVVFLLDCSGSMADPAYRQVVSEGPSPSQAPPEPPTETVVAVPATQADTPEAEPLAPAVPVQRKIDLAHDELVEALERLPAGTRLNVLFFNDALEAYAPHIVTLEAEELEGLRGFVRATAPRGPTALATAMRTAFVMNARRVVLLSDGLGNIGGGSDDVLRDAREAMLGGVRIDTVGLGPGHDVALMSRLATESGGVYQNLQ